QRRQHGIAIGIGAADRLIVLQDPDARVVGDAHDAEAVADLPAEEGMAADVADAACNAQPGGVGALEARHVRGIGTDIVLPRPAGLDLAVGVRDNAIAVSLARGYAALESKARVAGVTLGRATRTVVTRSGERALAQRHR